jgi:hypothetical protein
MFAKKSPIRLLCLLGLYLPLIFIFSVCGTAPAASAATSARGQPDWVRDPYTRYSRQTYVAARGSGNTRETAEASAFGNLVAYFGQEIQMDERVVEVYQEAVRDGVTAGWSVNTELDTMIARSARFDTLIGAEIGDVWNDGTNFFAVALLNRARAIQIYTDIVRSNQSMIENLLNIPAGERNTLDGLARYQFAATVADMTAPFVNMLAVIGGPAVPGLRSANDIRLEAQNITRAIPIYVQVEGDRAGRVAGAFRRALSEMGFQSGGMNSRYRINANVEITPVSLGGNPNSFSRIELTANLEDTVQRTVLLPFTFNAREGHTSQAEADNRTIMTAERRINAEYTNLLRDYLNRLLPSR